MQLGLQPLAQHVHLLVQRWVIRRRRRRVDHTLLVALLEAVLEALLEALLATELLPLPLPNLGHLGPPLQIIRCTVSGRLAGLKSEGI